MSDELIKIFIAENFEEVGFNKYKLKPKNIHLIDNKEVYNQIIKKYKKEVILTQINQLQEQLKTLNEN